AKLRSKHRTFSASKGTKVYRKDGWSELAPSLLAARGYFSSARALMAGCLLNVNAVTGSFWAAKNVGEILYDYGPTRKVDVEHDVKGLRVIKLYGNGSKHTVFGLGKPPGEQTFTIKRKNGETERTSVQRYFQEVLEIHINYPESQCVNVGGSGEKAQWIPAEHLGILPFQPYTKQLPPDATKAMILQACRGPADNRNAILKEGLECLGLADPTERSHAVANMLPAIFDMVSVPRRQIQAPCVEYRDQARPDASRGNWNLKGCKFYNVPRDTYRGGVLYLVPGNVNPTDIGYLHRILFEDAMKNHGFNWEPAWVDNLQFSSNREGHWASVVDKYVAEWTSDGIRSDGTPLVVLITDKPKIYGEFKTKMDRDLGVHSICLRSDTRSSGDLNFFANISMKLNLKRGGTNHIVKPSGLAKLFGVQGVKTLVLGADVTHPGSGSGFAPSIAALAGSVDGKFGRFLGSMRLNPRRQEIIADIGAMALERIRDWKEENGRLPESILYYRDGVGESQYRDVLRDEVDKIQAECRQRFREYNPRVTAVIVTKRHHTRFYPTSEIRSAANGNCLPGTCVESGVTSPYYFDFYLQSHHGIQGTAKPAHYFVVRNDMRLSAAELQDLTHNLCYTYVRSAAGVSYAAPAYYADRLCERGRSYLGEFSRRNDASPPEHMTQEEGEDAVFNRAVQWWTRDNDGNPWHQGLSKTMFWM
ncbi:ribonuclease H-like domain-containing protein, partial [Lineolata rhizophorae]